MAKHQPRVELLCQDETQCSAQQVSGNTCCMSERVSVWQTKSWCQAAPSLLTIEKGGQIPEAPPRLLDGREHERRCKKTLPNLLSPSSVCDMHVRASRRPGFGSICYRAPKRVSVKRWIGVRWAARRTAPLKSALTPPARSCLAWPAQYQKTRQAQPTKKRDLVCWCGSFEHRETMPWQYFATGHLETHVQPCVLRVASSVCI